VDRTVSSPENIRHLRRRLNGAERRKVNKNLYEITGLVGKPGLISLRHPFRSRYLPVPPVGPTARRVLYSTHREDSHYREQSRRIVHGRVGPRQIVTYFTFLPKGPADLVLLLSGYIRTDDACRGDGCERSERTLSRLRGHERERESLIEGGKSRSHYPRRSAQEVTLHGPRRDRSLRISLARENYGFRLKKLRR